MNETQTKKSEQAVEGEGSYRATHEYNRHLAQDIADGELEAGAKEARLAMEGPEAQELLDAAARAKRGPEQAKGGAAPTAKRAK